MSSDPDNLREPRMLPGQGVAQGSLAPAAAPPRQLGELPKEELEHLAEEFGLDASNYKSRQHLIAAIHERRQLIATLDREAMLDVIRWGRRPIPVKATREQLAQEIARIRSMKFDGLTERGLIALARLRGVPVREGEPLPGVIKRLKRQEGFFARLNRKRRALLGSLVSSMLGGEESSAEEQFLPPQPGQAGAPAAAPAPPPPASIKEEIEEAGLFGGIAGRIRRSADAYINQKLDEIEARIDRKLDEIDRRLAEWRDKEIANRIRILKITLWASVIVAALALMYTYVKVYFVDRPGPEKPTPAMKADGKR